jgi:hypothetical protein
LKVLQHSVVRLFEGAFRREADIASAPEIARVVDQSSRFPLEVKNYAVMTFPVVATGSDQVGPTFKFWPDFVFTDDPVFVAIESTALIKASCDTPDGPATWILMPTNSLSKGVHAAQFQFQGYVDEISFEIPSVLNGGFDGEVKIVAFQVPPLTPTYVIGLT